MHWMRKRRAERLIRLAIPVNLSKNILSVSKCVESCDISQTPFKFITYIGPMTFCLLDAFSAYILWERFTYQSVDPIMNNQATISPSARKCVTYITYYLPLGFLTRVSSTQRESSPEFQWSLVACACHPWFYFYGILYGIVTYACNLCLNFRN